MDRQISTSGLHLDARDFVVGVILCGVSVAKNDPASGLVCRHARACRNRIVPRNDHFWDDDDGGEPGFPPSSVRRTI